MTGTISIIKNSGERLGNERKGDERYEAAALVDMLDAVDGEFDPYRDCVYEYAIFDNLKDALEWVTKTDQNNEGSVHLQWYNGHSWLRSVEYDFMGGVVHSYDVTY